VGVGGGGVGLVRHSKTRYDIYPVVKTKNALLFFPFFFFYFLKIKIKIFIFHEIFMTFDCRLSSLFPINHQFRSRSVFEYKLNDDRNMV
jgi:hypothetical protein